MRNVEYQIKQSHCFPFGAFARTCSQTPQCWYCCWINTVNVGRVITLTLFLSGQRPRGNQSWPHFLDNFSHQRGFRLDSDGFNLSSGVLHCSLTPNTVAADRQCPVCLQVERPSFSIDSLRRHSDGEMDDLSAKGKQLSAVAPLKGRGCSGS